MNKKIYAAGAVAALLGLSACTQLPWTHPSGAGSSQQQNSSSSQGGTLEKSSGTDSSKNTVSAMSQSGVHVVADPESNLVLVNKYFKLPDSYVPSDLVDLDVPFISGKSEKKKMRAAAAEPLKEMFAAAKRDGVQLAGVSAYRSHKTQVALFNYYVRRDGEKKAQNFSARPGTSEHETGLAIDVSGINGKYAATQEFGKTPEAAWLAKHAQDYGFIVRYPEGKETVTGYEYEAWHLRYVGLPASKKMVEKHQALEEYLNEVPVSD